MEWVTAPFLTLRYFISCFMFHFKISAHSYFECLNSLISSLNILTKLLLFKQYKSIYTLQWYKSKFKNIFDHLNLADTIQNIFIKKNAIGVYLDKKNCEKNKFKHNTTGLFILEMDVSWFDKKSILVLDT